MPLKRIAKVSIAAIVLIAGILTGAYCYFFYRYLPHRFQEKILPELVREIGISGFSGKVKSAGASGANLGELCIGSPENPTLKINSVIIKYRFRNLLMPHKPDITSLEFNGLELVCRIEGEHFEINHIDIGKFIAQLRDHFSGRHRHAVGSWGNTKLKITNGLMRLDWNGTRLLLPFELLFHPEKQNWETFTADLHCTWRKHPVKAELRVDLDRKTAEISFKARAEMQKTLELIKRTPSPPPLSGLELTGLADLTGNIRFGFTPWKIRQLTIATVSKNCTLHYGTLTLHNERRPSGMSLPLSITVNYDGNEYIWKLRNGLTEKPFFAAVHELSCRISETQNQVLNFDGEFEFDLARLKLAGHYGIRNESRENPVRKLSGRFNRVTKNWQLQTVESGGHARAAPFKTTLSWDDMKIFAEIGELGFSGRGCGQTGNLALKILVKKLSATGYQNAFFSDNIELNSDFRLAPDPDGKMLIKKNFFKLAVPEFFCSSLERRIKLNDLTVSGSNVFDGLRINGFELIAAADRVQVKQDDGLLTAKDNRLTLDGVFQKNKKTWELAATAHSGQLTGFCGNNDFKLLNARGKSFLSLSAPLLQWSGLKNGNVRLKCDSGNYGNEEKYLKFSGFEAGTALTLDKQMQLTEQTASGKINRLETKYRNFGAVISGLELAGKFNRDSTDNQNPGFRVSLETRAVRVTNDDTEYAAEAAQLKLAGKTFAGVLRPESVRAGIAVPTLTIIRGKDRLQISNAVLDADCGLSQANCEPNYLQALNRAEFKLALDKLSGNWNRVNVQSAKNVVTAGTAISWKNSAGHCRNLKVKFKNENTVAYGKSWKLAAREISLHAGGGGSLNASLGLKPELHVKDFYAASHDASFNVPEVSVTAKLADRKISGEITYADAAFRKNSLKLVCAPIRMKLPFGTEAAEGALTVDKVKLHRQNLGKVEAKLKVRNEELLIRASHFSDIFPNASVFFRGKAKLSALPDWEGDFIIPEFKAKNALCANVMFPGLGAGFVGKAAVEGHLQGDLNTCNSSGSISLTDGTLYLDCWELNGLTANCTFTDLFGGGSLPHQKLYCRRVKNASLELANLQLEFQSRGFKKIQVEHLSANWFGGRLTSLGPFILTDNVSVPETVNFLASGITLSPFLDYLGIKGFATDASVGGTLPFRLNRDRIFIADAALTTQAGKRGFVRLEDNWDKDVKTAADKAELNRRKFMAAVLKQFNYNWIRLQVTTAPQIGKVCLSLDGYPEKATAFRYDSAKALFEPVSPGEPGTDGDMTIETEFKIPKLKVVK
ncbi:MAG: YdbH domain-containing protein [Victivallaceae bacterium]|nr:YdbH domain-containing protein [Victivallaceae bacterium]